MNLNLHLIKFVEFNVCSSLEITSTLMPCFLSIDYVNDTFNVLYISKLSSMRKIIFYI